MQPVRLHSSTRALCSMRSRMPTTRLSRRRSSSLQCSALPGVDFVTASGTVTFAAGQTSATITIEVIGDTAVEGDELFGVSLSSPTGGATIDDGQGTVTVSERIRKFMLTVVVTFTTVALQVAGVLLALAHPPIALATAILLFVSLLYHKVTSPRLEIV